MIASTNLFNYDKETRTFSQEISTLEGSTGGHWATAYMTLKSHRTGAEVEYEVERVERDGEGDVEYWVLKPTRRGVVRCPAAKGTKVVIYND